jgi:hypothetical protein
VKQVVKEGGCGFDSLGPGIACDALCVFQHAVLLDVRYFCTVHCFPGPLHSSCNASRLVTQLASIFEHHQTQQPA